jgi:hypothetical protein
LFEALEPFVKRSIPQKNTPNRPKGKLSSIIGSEIWPTCTTKDAQRAIIRFFMKKEFNRGIVANYFAGKDIDEVGCS